MTVKNPALLWPLTSALTCTGSTGLMAGFARAFQRVEVESSQAAPLTPIPLQTGEGGKSMWQRDTPTNTHTLSDTHAHTHTHTRTQPIIWHRQAESQPFDRRLRFPSHSTAPPSTRALSELSHGVLETSNNAVKWRKMFCPFLWWNCKMEMPIHFFLCACVCVWRGKDGAVLWVQS